MLKKTASKFISIKQIKNLLKFFFILIKNKLTFQKRSLLKFIRNFEVLLANSSMDKLLKDDQKNVQTKYLIENLLFADDNDTEQSDDLTSTRFFNSQKPDETFHDDYFS